MTGRLDRLLRPRSLAFVGGAAAELAIDACRSFGYKGDMWAVNPRRELRGLPTLASASELPAGPDAALVGVGRHAAVEVVRALAAAGTGAAVCHASGFAETGEAGAALQAELVDAAAGMALVGPNCYGTLSAVAGAALWPDVHGLARCQSGVAFVSQSGNIAVNLTMQRHGLDVAHVLALGNQADVGVAEALEALVADEAVTGVGLVVEAVDDVARFAAAVHSARERSLPVVALKLGASQASGAIAISHTASLVGDDAAYDALFARLGVRRVHTVPELLDSLSVLCAVGPLRGNRLASMSCSGGEASLVADRARCRDLAFPSFAPDHADRVASALDGRVAVTNPLDYHTFIWGDEARLTACFGAVLDADPKRAASDPPFDADAGHSASAPPFDADAGHSASDPPFDADAGHSASAPPFDADAGHSASAPPFDADAGHSASAPPFDAALLVLDFPAEGLDRSRWWPTLRAFAAACSTSGTPGVVAASMAENLPLQARTRAAALGLVCCADIDNALSALEAAAAWGQKASAPAAGLLAPPQHPDTGLRVLSEHEAKQRLAAAGIAVPAGTLVPAEEAAAAAAAAKIGYPVAVKASGMAHKSDTGAVAVGLADAGEVTSAVQRLAAAGDGRVLVESLIPGAVAELLVSVRPTPPVGMLLTLGAGGTLAELLDDTVSLLLPAAAGDILEALRSLRTWPLLAGYRGRPAGAVDAVVEAVDALGALVRDDRSIFEVEINPLMVTPHGAVAADALMLVAELPAHD